MLIIRGLRRHVINLQIKLKIGVKLQTPPFSDGFITSN